MLDLRPIIVNESMEILGGNMRFRALLDLGIAEAPVTIAKGLSKEKQEEFIIKDNVSGGDWDWTMLANEWDTEKLSNWGLDIPDFIEKLEATEDDFDTTPPVEPKTKLGDLYRLGDHVLLCGNSKKREDVERLMGGEKANLFLTDPPYGVSYTLKNIAVNGDISPTSQGENEIENDELTLEEIKPVWFSAAKNALDFCFDDASYYWFACQGGDQMMMMMMMLGDAGWLVRHELIWKKSSMVFGRSDYHYAHEPIIYGWKKKGKHNWYSDRKQTSVLEFDRPSKSELHPTTKPVELVSYLMGNNTQPGNIVLDLFGGSGTTLIASEQTSRKCRMMEISEKYCDVIINRWIKLTGKEAYRINQDGTKTAWSEIA